MEKGSAPYLSPTVFRRVIEAQRGANKLRDCAILHMSYYCGVRAKELAALRIGDVYDLEYGILETVRLTASMTKGGKPRDVFLVKLEAIAALDAYLSTRSVRRPFAPLFFSQKGSNFSANTMQRMVSGLYAKANISASSHAGRRSYATNLIAAGVDIFTIKTMLGHRDISTTQRYFETSPERMKRAASLL